MKRSLNTKILIIQFFLKLFAQNPFCNFNLHSEWTEGELCISIQMILLPKAFEHHIHSLRPRKASEHNLITIYPWVVSLILKDSKLWSIFRY